MTPSLPAEWAALVSRGVTGEILVLEFPEKSHEKITSEVILEVNRERLLNLKERAGDYRTSQPDYEFLVLMSPSYSAMPSLGEFLRSLGVSGPVALYDEESREVIAVAVGFAQLKQVIGRGTLDEIKGSGADLDSYSVGVDHVLKSDNNDPSRLFVPQDTWHLPEETLKDIVCVRAEWACLPREFAMLPFWFVRDSNSPIGAMARILESSSSHGNNESYSPEKPFNLSDIDAVAVTTDRFQNVRELLRSVSAQFGTSIRVTVVVQSKKSWKWTLLARRYSARFLHVEEDMGLAWSRNYAVRNTDRPLVLLMDDDFQVDGRCRLADALAIMNRRPEISVLAGNLLDVDGFDVGREEEVSQSFAMHLDQNDSRAVWFRVEDGPRERIFLNAIDYIEFVDIVDNFALFRRKDVFDRGLFWNPDLKIRAEHPDIYLSMKRLGGIKICRTNALKVRNVRLQDRKFRSMRQRNEFIGVFLKYWRLRSFVVVGDFSRLYGSDGSVWAANSSSPTPTVAQIVGRATQ